LFELDVPEAGIHYVVLVLTHGGFGWRGFDTRYSTSGSYEVHPQS